MKHYLYFVRLCLVVLILLTCGLVKAQTTTNTHIITVEGEVLKPLSLSSIDIAAMKHMDIQTKDKDGVTHVYSGVPLSEILTMAGVSLGKELRGKNLAKLLLVKASDGYEVVFALPEIDPEFSDKVILLADKMDGKSLAAGIGPFRIVVPEEKRQARWIREVTILKVIFAKE